MLWKIFEGVKKGDLLILEKGFGRNQRGWIVPVKKVWKNGLIVFDDPTSDAKVKPEVVFKSDGRPRGCRGDANDKQLGFTGMRFISDGDTDKTLAEERSAIEENQAARTRTGAENGRAAYYSLPVTPPKNAQEGIINFVQTIINDLERGDAGEALLKAVDLRNDLVTEIYQVTIEPADPNAFVVDASGVNKR